jgi:hypothetical protein
MSRIAIPAIEPATADIDARVKKIAGGRVPNTFAALGQPVSGFRTLNESSSA